MAWFSVIKNIDMDRLKEEVNAINAMIEDYESERDSAMEKLDGLVYDIGQKILDGELYDDEDIRRMAEDMQRRGDFNPDKFDDLWVMINRKAGFPQKPEMSPSQIQEVIQQVKDRDSALLSRK